MMFGALRKLFGWLRPPPAPAVRLTGDGFEVVQGSRLLFRVRWADVREVFAFKEDGRTCLGFRVAEGVAYYRVDEDEPGFAALAAQLGHAFPDHERDWLARLERQGEEYRYATVWSRPGERRRAPRRPARAGTAVACRRGPRGTGPNFARSLRDVSPRGVGLLLDAPLAGGEEVMLSLGDWPVVRPGRVAWSRRADGGYAAGVRLDEGLDARELSLLADGGRE